MWERGWDLKNLHMDTCSHHKLLDIGYFWRSLFLSSNRICMSNLSHTASALSKTLGQTLSGVAQFWDVIHQHGAQFSCSVVSDSLWFHGLQHARLPCPSPTPGAYWQEFKWKMIRTKDFWPASGSLLLFLSSWRQCKYCHGTYFEAVFAYQT